MLAPIPHNGGIATWVHIVRRRVAHMCRSGATGEEGHEDWPGAGRGDHSPITTPAGRPTRHRTPHRLDHIHDPLGDRYLTPRAPSQGFPTPARPTATAGAPPASTNTSIH